MSSMNEPLYFGQAQPAVSMFEASESSAWLDNLGEHLALFRSLHGLDSAIGEAADLLSTSVERGGKLLFCGNGGSAADSQHLAAELTGRFVDDRRPLAALALSSDTSALTCIGNDYGFEEIFARQLRALGRTGDVLVAMSTSGDSGNVIRAAEQARTMGIKVVGLLGRDGGALRALCDVPIVVRHPSTARIQEAHMLIGHTLCGMLETALGLA
jgi:D-sedoheptulose 7-phosphate isomerase